MELAGGIERRSSSEQTAIESWVERIRALAMESRADALHEGLDALWQRAWRTMGESTLLIFDRVLSESKKRNPILESLYAEEDGVHLDTWIHGVDIDIAIDAIGDLVTTFLSTLGDLTGDILTPALDRELSRLPSISER
jgi:hypothetical protein